MNSKPLIILASARSTGNTHRAIVGAFDGKFEYNLVDLNHYKIHPYSYVDEPKDDFLKIIEALQGHEAVIFATPVYWYAMSGPLKIFFDRLSDLISGHKPIGRSLSGKRVFLLATGTDPELPPGFETPFKMTAAYFSMRYCGSAYFIVKGDSITSSPANLDQFMSDASRPSTVAASLL
jgi:putative NADPH-quinone reductase